MDITSITFGPALRIFPVLSIWLVAGFAHSSLSRVWGCEPWSINYLNPLFVHLLSISASFYVAQDPREKAKSETRDWLNSVVCWMHPYAQLCSLMFSWFWLSVNTTYLPHLHFLLLLFVIEYRFCLMTSDNTLFRIWMTNLFYLITLKVPLACTLDSANALLIFWFCQQNPLCLVSSSDPFIL
jgi:hypothetical protein